MRQVNRVDRRLFIPDRIWHQAEPGEPQVPLDRADDPDLWEKIVASDDPVTIQVEDGQPGKWGHPWPTSSSTAPWLMDRMLGVLDLEPGMRVLEIGAGTGWNAAVLADAGAEVVSVEIDAGIAELARANLARAGFADRVTVVTGDGERGAPGHGPFHRIIATAAAHTIPYAWVEQAAQGALIVAPYTGEHGGGALLVLTVADGTAAGESVDHEAWFMPMRGQRLQQDELRKIPRDGRRLRVRVTREGQEVTTA
ncbi:MULTISPECIES: methyltransferase domain-containing protein [Actinomadura]|uniref:Protein-L-isoaspartate O-methyltransferase n=2 Tax=Actinomadura yumaensis TaxID=111807 RepID=A0ABW2CXG9_9ACTN